MRNIRLNMRNIRLNVRNIRLIVKVFGWMSVLHTSSLHCNNSNIIIIYHQNYIIVIVVYINMAVTFYHAVTNQILKRTHQNSILQRIKKDGNEMRAL